MHDIDDIKEVTGSKFKVSQRWKQKSRELDTR